MLIHKTKAKAAAPEVAAAGVPKEQSGKAELTDAPGRKLSAMASERGKKIPSGTLGDPIFTDRVAGSKEDQALVEKLIGRGLAGKGSRAVAPNNPGAAALRSARVAARFDKRVVWVEGLNSAGLTFRGLDREVIFLNPDSGRSAQVLTAHELTHQMAGENQRGFAKLAQALNRLIPPEVREKFKKHHDLDGTMSPNSLWQEMASDLVADWAYRAHADVVSAEDAARGAEFTGYKDLYLAEDKQAEADAAIEQFVNDAGHDAGSFFNKQTNSTVSTQAERDAAIAYVEKVLGPQVKVEFKDITGYSGEFIEAQNLIQISTTAAAGAMGTAYHEAMHKFFADFVRSNPTLKARRWRLKENQKGKVGKLN